MKNNTSELTAREFARLSHEEKVKRYAGMSPHEQFIWRTQYEILSAQAVESTVKMTDEEKEKYQKMLDDILRKKGILKD